MRNRGAGGTAIPQLTNVVFAQNEATGENFALGSGGAVANRATGQSGTPSLSITNATFTGNVADGSGGAIYNEGGSTPEIETMVLWGNTAGRNGDEIYNSAGSATLAHTLIQGGVNGSGVVGDANTDGGGNRSRAPQFRDASSLGGPDGVLATADDGVSVTGGSPVLDAGDNAAVPADLNSDISGAARTQDQNGSGVATVNIGAYERLPERDVAVTGGAASGLGRTFRPTPDRADQPAGVFRLTPTTDASGFAGVVLSVGASGATGGVDRVSLWRSADDQFDAADDTELALVDTDPNTTLSTPLTLDGFSKALPAQARFLFVPVTLTDQAEGAVRFSIASETNLRLQGGQVATVNGISQDRFSDLALSSDSSPLSVELSVFDGTTTEDGVRLTWRTASETNNAGFRVQRKVGTSTMWVIPA